MRFLDFIGFKLHCRNLEFFPRNQVLGSGVGGGFNGLYQGQKLVGDMLVRVVEHRTVHKIAAVQSFLGVGMKPDPDGRPAEKRKNAADS